MRAQAALIGDTCAVKSTKLVVNSVYGKFLENQIGRCIYKVITDRQKQMNIFRDPLLKTFSAISPITVIAQLKKAEIEITRPTPIGLSILDNSKMIMTSFFYGVLEPTFGVGNAKVFYSDTDSLVVELPGFTHTSVLEKISSKLDTSNFDPSHHLYTKENSKKIFFF